jgi:hypothetical protein
MSLVRRQLLRKRAEMTIERHPNGINIYSTRKGYLVQKMYIGYTIREAKRLFIEQYGKEEAN